MKLILNIYDHGEVMHVKLCFGLNLNIYDHGEAMHVKFYWDFIKFSRTIAL